MIESPVRPERDRSLGDAAQAGAERANAARTLTLDEVTTRAVLVKCMGRTYAAATATATPTATDGELVTFSDVTDITRPADLGTALRSTGTLWDVRTPEGSALLRTGDLLPALAALRTAYTAVVRR